MHNLHQDIKLKNTLQTTIYITPQMKQSLAILQMPLQELSQEILSIIEDNPVLELIDGYDGDICSGEKTSNIVMTKDFSAGSNQNNNITDVVTGNDWLEYIGSDIEKDINYRPMSDNESVDYEQFIESHISLYNHLLNQLKVQSLDSEGEAIGEYIIGNLSDDGYFSADIDSSCIELNVSKDKFIQVLSVIKTFDPSGIASQSLRECITTQMKDFGCENVYIEIAAQILSEYSVELASFNYDKIMKSIGIESDTFDYIFSLIKKTDPKPGLNFSGCEAKFITPDVFIVRNGEDFDILLNESGLPSVGLNSFYIKMLKDSSIDAYSKKYIKEKVKNAVDIIYSLRKRQKAIYKVVKAIINYQKDFLKYGESKLKALRLKDIAEATELHESTVSRVTSGKYAMTDRGLLELKSFFTKSVVSDNGDISTRVVKSKIKELIDSEKKDDPLSDQKIVELMDSQGIKIARRTVAKYRDEMSIPTMSQRKRLRR